MDGYTFTEHARLRMAQRGLSEDDLAFVIDFGQVFNTPDATIYFMDSVLDFLDDPSRKAERLKGTAVLVAKDSPICITVWRNRKTGRRNIHHKLAKTDHFSKPYASGR